MGQLVRKMNMVVKKKAFFKFFFKKGFTLVEIIIFIAILSLIFTSLISLITYSLSTTKTNERKIIATHFADEAREWLRSEKEADWEEFVGKIPYSPITYCLNANPLQSFPSQPGGCSDFQLNNIFKREVILSKNSNSTQVTCEIVVSWQEKGENYHQVKQTTIFTPWE